MQKINIKKVTKEQMLAMLEEAQGKQEAAEAEAATYFEDGAKLAEENEKLRGQIGEMGTREQQLRAKNAVLTEKLDQMNGEAITRENEIANLKADADVLRNKLADTEAALGRANAKLTYSVTEKNELQIKLTAAEGALGKMNDKIVRCEAYSRTLRGDVNMLQLEKIDAGLRANYAESHPWRNLWAWLKHKLKRA